MLLNFEDLSTVKKAIEVEIPAARISTESDRVTAEFGRQANLPGFRPGKVPVKVVRSRFAKEIQEEVMSRLLPVSFQEAIAGKGLEPVGDPHLEHLDPFIDGAPVKYKAQFEVKPHIELAEYRGIDVPEPAVDVTEADVDQMIDRLREQASSYRPEMERGVEDGDYVVIDIASTAEGMEPKNDSGHVKMGEETPLPELHDELRGKRPGAVVAIDKTYGEDATNEDFRNRTVHHEVTLKEIRIQEKPEITDEFAKSFGGWDDVAKMRETIAGDIRKHREADVVRGKRNQIGDVLLARHHFEVPEALVEEELGKSLSNYARYLASQGVELDKAELDWRKIGEEFRPEALKRVRRSLILEAIARKENITVTDVEVDAEIRRASREQDREFADVKHRLKHEGGYEALRSSLAQERALDLLMKEAVVKK